MASSSDGFWTQQVFGNVADGTAQCLVTHLCGVADIEPYQVGPKWGYWLPVDDTMDYEQIREMVHAHLLVRPCGRCGADN